MSKVVADKLIKRAEKAGIFKMSNSKKREIIKKSYFFKNGNKI